jgi:hypothetical protein
MLAVFERGEEEGCVPTALAWPLGVCYKCKNMDCFTFIKGIATMIHDKTPSSSN